MKSLSDYVVFNDKKLARKYSRSRIPMATLYEAYFDGAIDIPGDIYALLATATSSSSTRSHREHLKWAVTNFIPEVAIHSKAQDERIVREHYDRGNDFFGWFLGERMIYTSAFFLNPGETLEEAQDNKLNLVCQKLQLQRGERLLDIGCGWGTLACHAARYYGADATGVTIAQNQAQFGNQRAKDWGVADSARILCSDYRDIPNDQVRQDLEPRDGRARRRQEPQGVLRAGLRPADRRRPVLPAVDRPAPRPAPRRPDLGPVHEQVHLPRRGRELVPVGDAGVDGEGRLGDRTASRTSAIHYGMHDQALARQLARATATQVVAAYGERWFRIWHLFLAWSTIIAAQGNAACFQVVLNKNVDAFNRMRWIDQRPRHGRPRQDDRAAAPRAHSGC